MVRRARDPRRPSASHGSGPMTLADLLFAPEHEARDSDIVVHHGGREVRRGELVRSASEAGEALREAGVESGASVAVMLPNGPEAVAALFGVWAAGAVHVPCNPRLPDREVDRLLETTGPVAVVTSASRAERFPADVGLVEARGDLSWAVRRSARGDAVHDRDVALVQTTSGTTGPPKPVPLRHGTVRVLMDGVLAKLGVDPAARRERPMPNLVPVSLSLWAGIYNVLFALRVGAPVVLMETFDPRAFADLVARHAIRSTVLPPAAMLSLLDANERAEITGLAPLRMVRSITAPLSPHIARRFKERFDVLVLNSYGQTELGGEIIGWSATDAREHGDDKLGSVGRPHDGVEVRVADEEDVGVGTGEAGELLVRTPATSEATADARADRMPDERLAGGGWFRTGDLARVDEDGFVWIEGRVSDMINRGGLKVHPAEVEEVLRRHPGVDDAAVTGARDERLGEVPVAFVVGRDPADEALDDWCREQLAPYKVPVRFARVDHLPRNEVGKVLTRELQEWAERAGGPGAERRGRR